MIELRAPYPAVQTVSVLPNPLLSDSVSPVSEVRSRRSMSGQLVTYVKCKNRRKLIFDMRLSRMKALELRAFVNSYQASKMLLKDHLGTRWVGYLTINPLELEMTRRSANAPGDEQVDLRMEFEGEEA